jgi:hypothetical protein
MIVNMETTGKLYPNITTVLGFICEEMIRVRNKQSTYQEADAQQKLAAQAAKLFEIECKNQALRIMAIKAGVEIPSPALPNNITMTISVNDPITVLGLSKSQQKKLMNAGIETVAQVSDKKVEFLQTLIGIGPIFARKVKYIADGYCLACKNKEEHYRNGELADTSTQTL